MANPSPPSSEASSATPAEVGAAGVRLPAESEAVVDVLFDGRRIWRVRRFRHEHRDAL